MSISFSWDCKVFIYDAKNNLCDTRMRTFEFDVPRGVVFFMAYKEAWKSFWDMIKGVIQDTGREYPKDDDFSLGHYEGFNFNRLCNSTGEHKDKDS